MIVQTEAFVGIIYFIVAENFLEKPTALGVPLGALLLFFWVMRAIQENKSSGQQSVSTRRSVHAGFSPSTESIPLAGEVDDSVVTFSASATKAAGGRTIFSFTIKLRESGTFFVAAGQLRSGRLSRQHYGMTQVTGSRGETISGTVSSPEFSSGKWAIGAYRIIQDVELA
ncbi:hypothetical protein N9A92_02130 [Pirellulales bacterium]|nr:hypothetical protein [Pirellulales bacterium]